MACTDRVALVDGLLELARVLHDGLEVRQARAHLEDLLQLHVVLDDQHVRLAVGGHVLARFRRVRRVDAHREPAAHIRHTTIARVMVMTSQKRVNTFSCSITNYSAH